MSIPFDSLLSSFSLVALSEMGDKTQLLAFSLAARFKAPGPILAGILVATVLNHALASTAGAWVAGQVPPRMLATALGLLFIAFGLWTLKPDEHEDEGKAHRFGPFLTTTVVFFLAEMGDKTQLATVALAARFQSAFWVTLGTTAGMMLSDGLAVLVGEKLGERIPMKPVRWVAASIFIAFGIASIFGTLR